MVLYGKTFEVFNINIFECISNVQKGNVIYDISEVYLIKNNSPNISIT